MYRVMLLDGASGEPALFCSPSCYDAFRVQHYKMKPMTVARLAHEKLALRKAWAFSNSTTYEPMAPPIAEPEP